MWWVALPLASHSWSNGKAESVVSDSHAVLVKSSVENCRHGTPGHRGRLNATGGVHQLNDHLKSSRETQGSCRDSPYSERYRSLHSTPAGSHLSSLMIVNKYPVLHNEFCHDNSRRVYHGNVHDNVNVFGLGGIDLLHCCSRASIETCYCQYIHNTLLWACKKYCCCTYNIHE